MALGILSSSITPRSYGSQKHVCEFNGIDKRFNNTNRALLSFTFQMECLNSLKKNLSISHSHNNLAFGSCGIVEKKNFLHEFSSKGKSFTVSASLEAAGVTETGQFSISDSSLESRGLIWSDDYRDIDLDDLNILFSKVGFPTREKSKLSVALENTMNLISVKESKSGKLISFARATGDSVFNAIIWDVVVDPRYQGSGIGKAVMERLLSSLLKRGIINIALYAEPNVVSFYRPLGFATDPSGIRGMAYDRRRA